MMDYETKQVHANLPNILVEQADLLAFLEYTDRTAIIKEALVEYIEEAKVEEEKKQKAIELYMQDEIDFDVLEAFLGRTLAESVRSSRETYEEGDEIASQIAEEVRKKRQSSDEG